MTTSLTYVPNITCTDNHPHHWYADRLPYECTEFVRPADGCSWGDCTRPSTTRSVQKQTKGRLFCDSCLRSAQICGLA